MDKPSKQLNRRTLRDDVIDYCIDCIMKKRFLPGDKIAETWIAEELSIGKGAVREALRDLVAMGFLENEPYKGARVCSFSEQDFNDYYEARADLMRLLTRKIFDSGREGSIDVKTLEELVEGMYEAAAEKNYRRQVQLDITFHKVFVKSCGNAFLVKAWESLGHEYWISLRVHLKDVDMEKEARKHRSILNAVGSKDPDRITRAILDHYDEDRPAFMKNLLKAGLIQPGDSGKKETGE